VLAWSPASAASVASIAAATIIYAQLILITFPIKYRHASMPYFFLFSFCFFHLASKEL